MATSRDLTDSPRPPRKPLKVTEQYLADLLAQYCLINNLSEDVAGCVARILIRRGVVANSEEAGLVLQGKSGALLEQPPRAGAFLHSALMGFVRTHSEFECISMLIRGTGASGSGLGLPRETRALEVERFRKQHAGCEEWLAELVWKEESIIRRMGEDLALEGRAVLDAVLRQAQADVRAAESALRAGEAAEVERLRQSRTEADGRSTRVDGPQAFILIQPKDRSVLISDNQGFSRSIPAGDVVWAFFCALSQTPGGTPLPIAELARLIDTVLEEFDNERVQQRHNLNVARASAEQEARRGRLAVRSIGVRGRPNYAEKEPGKVVKLIQAVLRQAIPAEDFKAWKKAWICWDRKAMTVTLRAQGER